AALATRQNGAAVRGEGEAADLNWRPLKSPQLRAVVEVKQLHGAGLAADESPKAVFRDGHACHRSLEVLEDEQLANAALWLRAFLFRLLTEAGRSEPGDTENAGSK